MRHQNTILVLIVIANLLFIPLYNAGLWQITYEATFKYEIESGSMPPISIPFKLIIPIFYLLDSIASLFVFKRVGIPSDFKRRYTSIVGYAFASWLLTNGGFIYYCIQWYRFG